MFCRQLKWSFGHHYEEGAGNADDNRATAAAADAKQAPVRRRKVVGEEVRERVNYLTFAT